MENENEWTLVADARGRTEAGQTLISISRKLNRLLLFKETYDHMVKEYGEEFDHVQIHYLSSDRSQVLLVPCKRGDRGARKITTNRSRGSISTRGIGVQLLLKMTEWNPPHDNAIQFSAEWAKGLKGLLFDMNKPLS
jgi:hypothetical protein